MSYTTPPAGEWGGTRTVTLKADESATMGAVREPDLVFEREFSVLINEGETWGGIQITEAGQPDLYLWKAYGAEIGGYTPSVVAGFVQGQGCKLLCTAGQFIFTWRERYVPLM